MSNGADADEVDMAQRPFLATGRAGKVRPFPFHQPSFDVASEDGRALEESLAGEKVTP
jgi:hypothetical protein